SGMAINPQMLDKGLEFKGRMMTLTVARVTQAHLDILATQLEAQLARSPGFFAGLPLLLELADEQISMEGLVGLLRKHGLTPVAVYRPSATQAQAARAAGLGVIDDGRAPREAAVDPAPAARKETRVATRIVTEPVRSGQQIYARGGDLVIVNAVSAGAEVIADGCVHIYGALRGRALAGVQGDTSARIFCRDMCAELVSIAGVYKVADDIKETVRGRSVQVYRDGDKLRIEKL
ncbi:MAG: septum site-determining protein MinC, partial [Nevskiales bacterium]